MVFDAVEDHKDAFLTVTRIELSRDLAHATVFVSALVKEKEAGALAELKRTIGTIQYALNRTLRMRPVPKITFAIDKAYTAETKVYEILSRHDETS